MASIEIPPVTATAAPVAGHDTMQANPAKRDDMPLARLFHSLRQRSAPLLSRVGKPERAEYDEQGIRIPPPHLIQFVTGNVDIGWFLDSGTRGAHALRDILLKNGVDIAGFDAILDFGCGVGRVLRHVPVLTGARLFGCDYNRKLIAWCGANLPFAEFSTNKIDRKLAYDDRSFDFIYALSVFTHLTAAQHRFWIDELRRALRPGGYLFLTTHGKHYEPHIPANLTSRFRTGELVVVSPDRAGENICAAFHPEKYVRDELARGWEMVDFVEQGALGNPSQDVYLLRNPMASAVR
jgi:SAM-dependent methyltransferase